MSFEDDISALIDRPCRRDGCARIVPESSPSDDFCSENCEASWRAENNGCEAVDYGDFGIEVQVPAGHPAAPTYQSPQEAAFSGDGPRSFFVELYRSVMEVFEREIIGPVQRFQANLTGFLREPIIRDNRQPSGPLGLMQILPSAWAERPPEGSPSVPAPADDVQRMREQIARIYGVPLSMIDPPLPRRQISRPGEFQVLNDLGSEPVNFTASPTPALPFNFFRAPGMPLDRAYHVLPPGEGEERRAELVHVAFDPATPDARPLFYTVETRYDHQHDRMVAELMLHLTPRPGWANVALDGIGYLRSVRSRAEEFRQLVHGEWAEPTEDAHRHQLEGAGLERLAGLDAEEIIEQARELGFVGVEPDRDQPET